MNKSEALSRLDAIEKEQAELRKIIEKGDKIVYDCTKIYIGIERDGTVYIMTGIGEESGHSFVFQSFKGIRPAIMRYSDTKESGQECIDYHLMAGFDIHIFDDTKEALQFFIDHL